MRITTLHLPLANKATQDYRVSIYVIDDWNIPRLNHSQGGMKFATQISPLLNLCCINNFESHCTEYFRGEKNCITQRKMGGASGTRILLIHKKFFFTKLFISTKYTEHFAWKITLNCISNTKQFHSISLVFHSFHTLTHTHPHTLSLSLSLSLFESLPHYTSHTQVIVFNLTLILDSLATRLLHTHTHNSGLVLANTKLDWS